MMTEPEKMTGTLVRQMEQLLSTINDKPVVLKIVYPNSLISIEFIKTLICNGFELEWREIIKHTKRNRIVFARMSFSYLAKVFTVESDEQIAQHIKRHRTAVIANSKTIINMMWAQDDNVYPILHPIIEQLKQIKNDTPSN